MHEHLLFLVHPKTLSPFFIDFSFDFFHPNNFVLVRIMIKCQHNGSVMRHSSSMSNSHTFEAKFEICLPIRQDVFAFCETGPLRTAYDLNDVSLYQK